MSDPTPDELVVRTYGNELEANTFATYAAIEAVLRFRLDAGNWPVMPQGDKVRAIVSAYHDLEQLPWLRYEWRRTSQTRDIGSALFEDERADPPVEDELFQKLIARAQAAQVIFLLGGAQVRSLQRDRIRLTRQLQGSEMEIAGYEGGVCVEALEILAPFLDTAPRLRTFA